MTILNFVRMGPFLMLQFNTSCEEALPLCQAMCCRMRKWYNVHLTDDEIRSGQYRTQTWDTGQVVLAETSEGDCTYLEAGRCSIYSRRPRDCQRWHCSPRGNPDDPLIEVRGQGWMMVPSREAKP